MTAKIKVFSKGLLNHERPKLFLVRWSLVVVVVVIIIIIIISIIILLIIITGVSSFERCCLV